MQNQVLLLPQHIRPLMMESLCMSRHLKYPKIVKSLFKVDSYEGGSMRENTSAFPERNPEVSQIS